MPFLLSAFWPSSRQIETTMPSADFCALTRCVSIQGAIGFVMRCCLVRVSLWRDSYQTTAADTPGPWLPGWPFPDSLMMLLSHVAQISPDKNVNFPCTTAAFTLSPEPVGFVMWCSLTRGLSLVCGFCPSARTFAARLPSDGRSPFRPCHWLVLVLLWFSYRGLAPHKFTPMPGVHLSFHADRFAACELVVGFGKIPHCTNQ